MRTVARTAVVAAAMLAGVLGLVPAAAALAACPNEEFRVGPSASLPDCRAYELVTPENLGRTEDVTFENGDFALAAAGGDALALDALGAILEPGANSSGVRAVFSRTADGWVMKPIPTPDMLGEHVFLEDFGPDLSQVAFSGWNLLSGPGGAFERGATTFRMGPVGGPYTTVAKVPEAYGIETRIQGVNHGVADGVPALSDVVVESTDHALLPAGPERDAAEQTEAGLPDLYQWSGGQLHLLNVNSEGKLLNPCGAVLGFKPGFLQGTGDKLGAVSDDGSKVFFTSPRKEHEGPGCPEPALYMRVGGRQTVDVSEPQGVSVSPGGPLVYVGASADGSKVFFATRTALTPAAQATTGPYLYEYDTKGAPGQRLALAGHQVPVELHVLNPDYLVSEDGSQVYYHGVCSAEAGGQQVTGQGICRYEAPTGEAQAGKSTLVAVPREGVSDSEPSFVTAGGQFFLFQSGGNGSPQPVEFPGPHGLERELRGSGGHQQLYRYDAADGSVMCVSCGAGAGPAVGFTELPQYTLFEFGDTSKSAFEMSEDGRRVFFQTTADLVPQDRNGAFEENVRRLGPGTDVYEWEQEGTEEAPGVFCRGRYGCTHLISAGEEVGPERLLGASANGRDVFFESAAPLLPQATPEFGNIYDARVDGGFPPAPAGSAECSSCQGVGSPSPQFGQSASETFSGAGAPLPPTSSAPGPAHPKPKPAKKCRRGFKRNRHGRCVRLARKAGGHR
jgi:hypothetical protein